MFFRLLISLVFLGLAAQASAESRSCSVDGLEGAPRVWESGVWADIEPGQAIPVEAKIVTGPEDRVRISCDDGTVVTIGVAAEVNLANLAGPSGRETNIFLQLIEGVVGVIAPTRSWGRFEVRTPVAIASVRATEWLVENSDGEAAVFVRAGGVDVRLADGRSVRLAEGEGITVAADGVAGEVKEWGAARIEKSGAALGFDWR